MRLKTRLLIILGACIAILPYLGFPIFWKRIFTAIAGVLVIAIALSLRSSYLQLRTKLRSLEPEREQSQKIM